MVNRTQALAPGFLLLACAGLVAILATAAEIYDQGLGCRPATTVGRRPRSWRRSPP